MPSEGAMPHIFDLLEKDHDEAKAIIEKIEGTSDRAVKTREQAFAKLSHALEMHMQFEEKVVYPALRKMPQFKDQISEAVEEHSGAKKILKKLQRMDAGDEEWMSLLEELKADLEHHIEEEENELFPEAREPLGEERGEEMGARYRAMKREEKKAA